MKESRVGEINRRKDGRQPWVATPPVPMSAVSLAGGVIYGQSVGNRVTSVWVFGGHIVAGKPGRCIYNVVGTFDKEAAKAL